MTTFIKRENGRLYFGETGAEHWSISDPESPELDEAMWAAHHGVPTREQTLLVLDAARSFHHLCTYRHRAFARRQLSDVYRAVRQGRKERGQ